LIALTGVGDITHVSADNFLSEVDRVRFHYLLCYFSCIANYCTLQKMKTL
jgi:hypothetical protein